MVLLLQVSCRAATRPILPYAMAITKKGRQIALPPLDQKRSCYFRLVAAVRSTDSLAMPVAPHQLDSKPPGLMSETLEARAVVVE